MRVFHHSSFTDIAALTKRKRASGQRISVCIPTLNEAASIGPIVESIRRELMERHAFIDELLVVDSGSTDATRVTAKAAGAKVFFAGEIAPEAGHHCGKGENLWKALHVAGGDVLCFIDGDLHDFQAGFIPALVAPLLLEDSLHYVKAFYERPLLGGGRVIEGAGGRVSEILIKPLLSLFYPDLARFVQPLAGEYAARRTLLEQLPFPTGYGVELAHLIDVARAMGIDAMAQVDLDRRSHRNRPDHELGRMAFAILRVLFRRLERDGKINLTTPLPELLRQWRYDGITLNANEFSITEPERPALKATHAS